MRSTSINAYDFIHSDVPEIDPLGFKENTVNMLLILSQSGDEYYHEHFPDPSLMFFHYLK
ncbi:hypothetical protein EfmAA96_18190 [Enterococcus faecium]|nr:hypothetical protein EfmAA96_18190 [Enterococcus faecium]